MKAKVRCAKIKVRDILETAWPVRRDEDFAQLSGRTQRYKRQGVNTDGKARETTVTAQRAGAARRSTTRSGTGRWQLRRPSAAASRRGIENRKTNVDRPKILKVTGAGLSDSEGKAQDDSVKEDGRVTLKTRRTTGIAQTVRRGGKTTAGDLTAKAKDRCGGTKVRNPLDDLELVLQGPRRRWGQGDDGGKATMGDGKKDGDDSRMLTIQGSGGTR
ncbi:hypothetical protein CF326_g8624 [Tilletia indica]|nr:hypothetical protein CF326_g8624 [Tilletia indica]